MIKWKDRILQFISNSKKPIFFIHTMDLPENIISLLQVISGYLKKESLFICLNSKIPYYYENLNLNFKAIDDYLFIEDYESIENFVYDFTRKWYLERDPNNGKGITEYDGIHLGSIVEYDFQLFLIRRLKWFQGMYKIINEEKPDRIIIIEDTGELLEPSELIEQLFHIPSLRLHNKGISAEPNTFAYNFKAVVGDIISSSIDSFMRFILQFGFKNKIIIDKRIYDDLNSRSELTIDFAPTPFEKGLRLRLNLLKKSKTYLPFYFPSNFKVKRKPQYKPDLISEGKEIYYFKGLSIEKLIEYKLVEYFSETFPRIKKNLKLLNGLLSKKLIKTIVLRHDLWELQKTCVEVAKKYNISTLVVQHGVFGEKGEEIIFADKIAVWGKMCVDIYEAFGNDPKKCRITGNPRLDQFYLSKPKFSREDVCRALNLDKEKKIIILASGLFISTFLSSYMTGDENNVIISEVVKAMKELPQYQLVIKLHPYENSIFSNSFIKYYNSNNVVVVKKFDLYSLINASELLLTKRSTVGLKAIVLGKPLIVINFEKRQEINPYVRSRVALEITRPADIKAAIISALEDSKLIDEFRNKSRVFIQDYAYRIDGKSSQRVLQLIEEIINNGRY